MVTLRREIPPAAIEIGEKLLFISAGKDMTCAAPTSPGFKSIETINIPTRKGAIDFFIFALFCLQDLLLNKRNRRQAVGFATVLTTALSAFRNQRPDWAVDQCTRIMFNAI